MNETKPLRLHIGCQEKYLEGYVNIDLPPEDHTAQKVKADVYADVRTLSYEPGTVDEIRSHHLLEHFSRPEALVLISRWHKWLKVGGLLIIETPDFEESVKKFIASDLSAKLVLGRHMLGSHEAAWAYHKEFWFEDKYRFTLSHLGFGDFRFEKFSNNLEKKIPGVKHLPRIPDAAIEMFSGLGLNTLPNIVCYAKKTKDHVEYEKEIRGIMSRYLVGREDKILEVWMEDIKGKV